MVDKKDSNPAVTQANSQTVPSSPKNDWEPVINEHNFMAAMIVLYTDPGAYANQPIEFSGFIYRQKDFPEDCVLVSRFGITCCAADAQVTGLLCRFKGFDSLSDDQWVKVKGIIKSQAYLDQEIPIVDIDSLQLIQSPANPYVY
jgi:putative membrane protein